MSEPSNAAQAIGWIEVQVERLSELRNAGTRDPAFREWRQNTLTFVQRIWPHIANRSTRFRRIPFSPASTRASDQEIRLAFDRGCGEARRMLKLWITELETHGIVSTAEGMAANGNDAPGNDPETNSETNAAPPPPPPPARPVTPKLSLVKPTGEAPRGTSRKGRSKLREMLGFVEGTGPAKPPARPADDAGDDAPNLPRAASAPPPPRSTTPPTRPARPGPPPPRSGASPARPGAPGERPRANANPPARTPAPPQLPEEFAPPALEMEPLGSMSEPDSPALPRGRRPSSPPPPTTRQTPVDAAPSIASRPRTVATPGPLDPHAGTDHPLSVTHVDPRAPMENDGTHRNRDAEDPYSTGEPGGARRGSQAPLSQSSPSMDAPESAAAPPLMQTQTPLDLPAPAAAPEPVASTPAAPPPPSAASAQAPPPVARVSPPAPPATAPPAPAPPPAHTHTLDADVLAESIAEAVRRAVDELLPRGTALPAAASPPAAPEPEPAPAPSFAPAPKDTGLPIVRFASKHDSKAAPFKSAGARTMARLSKEVIALGVPAGQRARVRAQLIDLACTLDRDKVDWQVLRDAMLLSMDFPPLACRLMPVLVAFLEDAA